MNEAVEAMWNDEENLLFGFGVAIGRLYTDHGLPIDMSLARFKYSRLDKVQMLTGVGFWLVQHKRNSGGTERNIAKQREWNRNMLADFIKTGETGVY